jgi:protein SCO1/2
MKLLTYCLLLGLMVSPLLAENPQAKDYFGDVELIDQDGATPRLYSDLMQGKIVVINSFFTTCTGVCPVMAGNLVKVQEWLGDRLGSEVNLISISLDPANDTEERVHEYAERFGARPGWFFITGEEANVQAAQAKLGQWVDDPEAHTSILLIGNVETGLWKKVHGLSDPAKIIPILESVLDDQGPEQG